MTRQREFSFGAGATCTVNANFSLRAANEDFDLDGEATISAVFRF